jgi:hypothetical protein
MIRYEPRWGSDRGLQVSGSVCAGFEKIFILVGSAKELLIGILNSEKQVNLK